MYIIDFNVSRKYDPTKEKMRSNTGLVQFNAPEVFDGEPYDDKVDVWGAGIVLFMLLSGVAPFMNEDL